MVRAIRLETTLDKSDEKTLPTNLMSNSAWNTASNAFFLPSHIFSLFLSDKSRIFTGRIFWSPMISLLPPQIGKIAMCWGLLCSSTMSHALCCDSFKVLLLWISPEVDIRHGSSSTGNFFMPNSSNFLRTFLFLVVPNNGKTCWWDSHVFSQAHPLWTPPVQVTHSAVLLCSNVLLLRKHGEFSYWENVFPQFDDFPIQTSVKS